MTRHRAPAPSMTARCNRTARVVMRATPLEVAEVQRQAATNGWTVSHFLRIALAQFTPTSNPVNTKENLRLASSLTKVSSGLSYLLRLCERQKVPLEELRPVIDEVQTVILDLATELRGAKP